jgi:hypothetical protein
MIYLDHDEQFHHPKNKIFSYLNYVYHSILLLMLLLIHFHQYYLSMKINQLDLDDKQHVLHYYFSVLNNIYNIELLNNKKQNFPTKNEFFFTYVYEYKFLDKHDIFHLTKIVCYLDHIHICR